MHEVLAPLEAEAVEDNRQHLEVVVLLVAHHVNHLIDGIVVEAHLGRTDVLRHINRGAVGADEQLLVEALAGEVGPDAAVFLLIEQAFLQAFHHLALALEVGVRLIINLIEAHAQGLVGLVEAGIHPTVHLLPEGADVFVTLLPFDEHLVGFLDEGSLVLGFLLSFLLIHALGDVFGLQFIAFLLIVLVEEHVEVADEVVALLPG